MFLVLPRLKHIESKSIPADPRGLTSLFLPCTYLTCPSRPLPLHLRHLAVEFPGPPVGLPFGPSCRPQKILQLLAAELAADSSYHLLEILQLLGVELSWGSTRHAFLEIGLASLWCDSSCRLLGFLSRLEADPPWLEALQHQILQLEIDHYFAPNIGVSARVPPWVCRRGLQVAKDPARLGHKKPIVHPHHQIHQLLEPFSVLATA